MDVFRLSSTSTIGESLSRRNVARDCAHLTALARILATVEEPVSQIFFIRNAERRDHASLLVC